MLGEEDYQQQTLTALLLWTARIGPIAALLNMIGFIADPAWTTLVGSGGVIVLVLFAWWGLRLSRRKQIYRAARIFVLSGMCIMAVVVFIAAKNEVLIGAMAMGVFIIIATFFEQPQSALGWGILSSLLYEAGLLARSLDPSRDLGLHIDIVSLYIVPPVILLFLALTGRIINEHLTRALRASRAAGLGLARSYAEVEHRVSERTHELVKERYRLSAALRELTVARDQAEAASRAKSAFLANMSHELRTPLTTILGYTSLIEHHERIAADPPLLSDLDRISVAGNHLLKLINDVLDLAQLESGDMQLHPQLVEIATLVEGIARAVGPEFVKNNNTLHVQCDQQVDTAQFDSAKVQQMLVILLSNAAKFTTHGTITLAVRQATGGGRLEEGQASHLSPPVSRLIVFEVSDTGIGIAPNRLPHLFQPFAYNDTSDARMHGGVGLGLAICRRFCQLMGGDLTVSSQLGQGSTFTIQLPAGPSIAAYTNASDAPPSATPAIADARVHAGEVRSQKSE
jgi:signal transduction histidine kinase